MTSEPEHTSFTALHTPLLPAEVRWRLTEANRRGKLPEVDWPDDMTAHLTLPSRPLVARLILRLHPENTGTRVTWSTRIDYRFLWIAIVVNVALIVVGPWSTELFFTIYSWYWQPPLYVLTALWIAWAWPRKSRSDTESLIDRWMAVVAQRLDAKTQ